jgi:hypothetical protein
MEFEDVGEYTVSSSLLLDRVNLSPRGVEAFAYMQVWVRDCGASGTASLPERFFEDVTFLHRCLMRLARATTFVITAYPKDMTMLPLFF